MPAKRPAAALPPGRVVYKTHLTRCFCSSSSVLKPGHEIKAVLYGMTGMQHVLVQSMRCTSYACRKTYGPNFMWDLSNKYNTADPENIAEIGALFVGTKIGFTLDYLKYHSFPEFRACVSAMAIKQTYQHTFQTAHADESNWFAKMHSNAIMTWVAIQDLHPLQLHLDIIIGNEITPAALQAYHRHIHQTVLPPKRKGTVKEIVADGHQKVHIKCANARKHSGKPPKHGRVKPFGHGWFMLVHPRDLRILAVRSMVVPENNEILHESLLEILPLYKNLDGVIMDRACGFLPTAKANKEMKPIKFWSVDGFHAKGHTKKCPCNPLYKKRLAKRFKGVNSSACEQVFAWFRNYARLLNESSPMRHSFKVLYFVKLHNLAVDQKQAQYLNRHVRSGKKAKQPYNCSKKKTGSKKRPASAMS